jgi:hypothetical protein
VADDNINEFLELSQYAGPVERSDALLKFKRYLTYDRKLFLIVARGELTRVITRIWRQAVTSPRTY